MRRELKRLLLFTRKNTHTRTHTPSWAYDTFIMGLYAIYEMDDTRPAAAPQWSRTSIIIIIIIIIMYSDVRTRSKCFKNVCVFFFVAVK